jgi:hypothetical protein
LYGVRINLWRSKEKSCLKPILLIVFSVRAKIVGEGVAVMGSGSIAALSLDEMKEIVLIN